MLEDELWTRSKRGFRSLLWRVQPRHLQRDVDLLLEKQREQVARGLSITEAYRVVYGRAAEQVLGQLERAEQSRPARRASRVPRNLNRPRPVHQLLRDRLSDDILPPGPDFHCDAALGGLTRWLWAAGYEARWWPGIDDDDLLGHALASWAILLTTDRRLMTRGVIARGLVPALLIPIALKKREQFEFVVSRFQLPLEAPRCMACGGRLVQVSKESVRPRIPPRTYAWLSEYHRCRRCNKLFWKGTHWERIGRQLQQALASTSPSP